MDNLKNNSAINAGIINKPSQNPNDVPGNKRTESTTNSQNCTNSTSFFAKYENLFKKFAEEISQIFTKTLRNREHPTSAKSIIEFLYQTAYCTLKMILELAMIIAGDIVVLTNIIKNVMAALAFMKAQHMHQQN